jgi:hypothetical protein
MRVIRDSSEDEMVLAFLSSEVDSDRFGAIVRQLLGDLELVRKADTTNAAANHARRSVLAQYRGWGCNRYLFFGFPADVCWKYLEVTTAELSGFRYAREPSWVELSGGSLLVGDGAANAGHEPPDRTKVRILAIEQEIRQGARFPPIVAVAEIEDQVHVLLEGHSRASAFVRALNPQDDTCHVIVGYVDSLSDWYWY